ncbi:MAG: hypothetical protein ABIS92_13205 [Polyangia bacterium]
MNSTGNTKNSSHIPGALSHRALEALVGQLTDGYPNPDDPNPPGPLDPYIRIALHQTRMSLGTDSPLLRLIAQRHPEVTDAPHGGPILLSALNPQPLPPKAHFAATLARVFADRMTVVQEVADLLPDVGGERGIIIVGGKLAAVIDELCGNSLRLKWPYPWPRPRWFGETFDGTELMAMGLQFHQAAGETGNRKLGQMFVDAAARLIEAGAGRMG